MCSQRSRGQVRADYRDRLTGLAGRRLFHVHLEKEVAHARRGRGLVGVALLDLDRFQKVNSTFGTGAGDLLLQKVARRLSVTGRESDTLARYGDDEFAVILTGARRQADLIYAAHRLLEALQRPFRIGADNVSVSASLGLGFGSAKGADAAELLSRAASALSLAKSRGPGSLELFDSSACDSLQADLRSAAELRQALRNGDLCVLYQPQVRLSDGRIVGAEGLVRWRHPERGLLTAGEFIPLAEEIGIMTELGSWLLNELSRQNASWQRRGLPAIPVSVNLSLRQFQAGGVASTVEKALSANDLDPGYLNLEITESIALHDVQRMRSALDRIRDLGVRIQLDDFGTGYSSLSYLLHFPVDVIKIDRSFVAQILESDQSRAIVRATLAMAASLKLEVIAEGVETPEQLRALAEMGCATAQGFLISYPLAPEEFEQALAESYLPLPDLPEPGAPPDTRAIAT